MVDSAGWLLPVCSTSAPMCIKVWVIVRSIPFLRLGNGPAKVAALVVAITSLVHRYMPKNV